MALYFIEYDLRNQRDYKALYLELALFGAKQILQSLWCFNHVNTTASNLRDHFKQYIDSVQRGFQYCALPPVNPFVK